MRDRRLRIGAGWLYVIAGLTICAAGILIPAQDDLAALRRQRDRLADEVAAREARLEAHRAFLDQLDRRDPPLIRRLAAAHLNLLPSGETPVLLASSREATIGDWIDASVQAERRPIGPRRRSFLSRLTAGPHRLWFLAGGVLTVFVGLLVDAGSDPRARLRSVVVPRWPTPRPADLGEADDDHGEEDEFEEDDEYEEDEEEEEDEDDDEDEFEDEDEDTD